MKGDAIQLAQLSAQIQTVRAAVGALDVCSDQLDIASAAVDAVPAGYGLKDPFAAGVAFVLGQTQDVQANLRDQIAQARTDVARYLAPYNGYTGDDLDQDISTAHSMGISSTIQYCNKVLNNCIDEIGDGPSVSAIDLVNGIATVLKTAAGAVSQAAQSVAQGAANVTAGIVSAFSVPIAVVGGGLLLLIAWQKGLLSK